ncbi:MAG: [protein-PII] uridylyltransferase [Porticoccaceae bacterium]
MFWRQKPNMVRPEFGALFFFDEARFARSLEKSTDLTETFRLALQSADEHLQARFLEGEEIHKIVRDRSAFIDRLIYHAWQQYSWDDNIALVAVGGYGRGEMHPHSDIDLLFLLRKDNPQKYKQSIEQFLTFLWDLQLQIGHSVRTPRQCAQSAREDVTIMTNLLERRIIVGAGDLEKVLQQHMQKVWPAGSFFKAKLEEQQQRHARHGITEFDLEPNVKESPGGLRDIQTIHWVAMRAYEASGLDNLAGKGLYTEEEYNSLKSAEIFLWKVRYGLHCLSRRPKEQLDFENQRRLADMFGYQDTPQRLAVEQFMQRYYQTASSVREITDVLMQLLGEELGDTGNLEITPINDRFQLRGQYLETTGPNVFRENPSSMLEVFVILSRDKSIEGIHGETIRQLRENGHLINEEFRAKPENRKLFMDLLRSPKHLSVPLQLMSRYAILGRYLPEFGAIMGLTQHDLFHIYPVDIHTMAVVRNIRQFGLPESRKKFPVSSYTFSSYPRPELLVVAGLYHDIGKGRGGDHSELGAIDVKNFAINHGFSPRDTKLLVWLVQNHLFMSRVAQREDISDPEVIANFARHVGDETRLNLLYTLTTADILATNPTLWNNWRASLMRQLYNSTRQYLRRGKDFVIDPQELIQETKDGAAKLLKNAGYTSDQYQAFWNSIDEYYFQREIAEDVAWHTKLLLSETDKDKPLVSIKPFVHYDRERATIVFIRTQKSDLLFYSAATAVGSMGLNIQDARLYETDKYSFLTLYILDENANPFNDNRQRIERLEHMLYKELDTNGHTTSGVMKARTTRRLKQFPVKTETRLLCHTDQTVLEVITADRPGLLAAIAEKFVAHDVVLKSAKITTLGERVEDLFVIENKDGSPVANDQKAENLQRDIRETIDQRVDEIATV